MKPSLRLKFLVALAVMAISGLSAAQDQSSDPPSRVVRLQHMEGQVSLQFGGVDDWAPASLNRPLTTADRIWTDADSRAELSMASAALRMGSETSVTLTNLDDNTAQIELDQGTLSLAVRYLNPGEIVEVDTPNFAYTVFKPGQYRFEVLPNQDTSWITVRHGDGEATGQGNAVRVHGGQQFSFSQGQSLNYQDAAMRPNDEFDNWSEMRERRETLSASAKYVAAGTVGYEDLDESGDWRPSAAYGTVWYPRVAEGWAPYRDGHWAWVEPWGWTWVDDAPWGFAPFHYGRWVNDSGRWGWVPGPVGVRPVYAPALVAWVGGANFGVSIGIGGGGGVGWFPLGYRDPYLPSYHVSREYARNVNISNSREVNVTTVNNYYSTTNVNIRNTTINNIHYENASVRGAATGVSSSTFASGKPVGKNSVVVPASAVRPTSMMTSAAVVPTKAAVLGGRAPAAVPQHIVAPRQVASKAAPPPRPVSFEQQRPLLEKSNGVPLSPETRATIRAANPAPAPRGGQPAGNQPGGRAPAANQPGGNQQRPPVTNQPGANQQGGRPPSANQPGGNPTAGRPPVVNAPVAPHPGASTSTPGAGTGHGQPNSSPNTPGRPLTQPTPPANASQPPANANQNSAPARNVPRPPQAGANGQTERPAVTPNRPVTPPAPARETTPVQPPRNAAPPPPRTPPAPARETAPAPPPRNAAPPPRTPPAPAREAAPAPPPRNAAPPPPRTPPAPAAAAPAPQRKTPPPPPAKENKNKDKEKEKEPK
jgi:hypothetical protein